jgi:hypothetical protein
MLDQLATISFYIRDLLHGLNYTVNRFSEEVRRHVEKETGIYLCNLSRVLLRRISEPMNDINSLEDGINACVIAA